MSRRLTDLPKAAIFYAITLVLALIVVLLPLGGDADLPQMLSMLTPTIAVLLLLTVVTRDGRARDSWRDLGLHRAGRRLWAAALLVPALVLLAAYAILWLTPYAAPAFPTAAQLPDAAVNTLANVAIVFILVLAEEIGWRGYLLPRLLGLGAGRATLLTGLLHGAFHLPLIVLTPFYHGDGDRLLVVPLFLLSVTLIGPIFGYLRLATGSVWPAVIAHTSVNVVSGLLGQATRASSPLAAEYLAGESGLLPLLGYAAVAGWCLYRMPGTPRRPAATVASADPAAATPIG